MSIRVHCLLCTLGFVIAANPIAAQTFEAAPTFEIVGTRAAGMGGAFVAVADDASATYWNPAGLALGRMFSLVVDRKVTDVDAVSLEDPSRHNTGSLITLGTPAVGFAHYQLRATTVTPAGVMIFRHPQGGETPVRV